MTKARTLVADVAAPLKVMKKVHSEMLVRMVLEFCRKVGNVDGC